MTDTLRSFVAKIDSIAVVIFNAVGSIAPIWHVIMESGEHRIIPPPHDDKRIAADMMRAYFRVEPVVRYVFIAEAWQLDVPGTTSPGVLREMVRRGLASQPNRIEALTYQAEDATGIAVSAQRVITRPPGKVTLGPLEFYNSKWSEGRFVGMLPAKGAMQ